MKTIILFASILVASGVLMVNLYSSLVDAKSWAGDVPNSIASAREYFKMVNPGNFFRIFSPVNQLLGLLALLAFWKFAPHVRIYLGIAFLMYFIAEGLTFAYFYPRNEILFVTADLLDVSLLKKTVSEWATVNWIRSLIILTGIIFSFISLYKIISVKQL